MKTLTLAVLIFCLGISLPASAQSRRELSSTGGPKNFYVSVCSGINSNTGVFGIQIEQKIAEHLAVYMGAGMGTWGTKVTVGTRYYFTHPLGSAFSFSLTNASGELSSKDNLKVIENGQEVKKVIYYNAKPISLINFSWLKYWQMGKKSRFNIEVGYCISLSPTPELNYSLKDATVQLTDQSKQTIAMRQPGGVLIGFGFNF